MTEPMSNADIAVAFLRLASSGSAREAWQRYGATDLIHHNPHLRGDAETLIAAMDENAHENPDKVFEVRRTITEGPMVAVHSRVQLRPDAPSSVTVHIFRIEDGRIRELWDVGQEIPADSPNEHGVF